VRVWVKESECLWVRASACVSERERVRVWVREKVRVWEIGIMCVTCCSFRETWSCWGFGITCVISSTINLKLVIVHKCWQRLDPTLFTFCFQALLEVNKHQVSLFFFSLFPSDSFQFKNLGGNSQNFLRKFLIFFVTLRCFYGVVIHRK